MNFRALMIALLLSGCGMSVPPMEFGQTSPEDAKIHSAKLVRSIAGHVHCELRRALYDTVYELDADWLWNWSALITLTLTVDEKSSVSPGLSLSKLLPSGTYRFPNGTSLTSPQCLGIGLGAGASADASRVEKIGWYLDFKDLKSEIDQLKGDIAKPCELTGTYPVEGSLLIGEGLYAGVETATSFGLVAQPKSGPLNVIEHHVTFDVNITGNVTPTWKLANVAANSGSGTFISGTRDRKDDLLITMGPAEIPPPKANGTATAPVVAAAPAKRVPGAAAMDSHLAAQIGQAVATALQGTVPAP
jgi:hypothetical protein